MFNKSDIFFYIILAVILLFCLKVYSESEAYNLKCIISGVDGEKYCVRERAKLELAADLLANVTHKCKELVNFVVGFGNLGDLLRSARAFLLLEVHFHWF